MRILHNEEIDCLIKFFGCSVYDINKIIDYFENDRNKAVIFSLIRSDESQFRGFLTDVLKLDKAPDLLTPAYYIFSKYMYYTSEYELLVAISLLQRSLSCNENRPYLALYNHRMAVYFSWKGQYSEAMVYLQNARSIAESFKEAYILALINYLTAKIYILLYQFDLAEKYIGEVKKYGHGTISVKKLEGLIEYHNGKYDEARALFSDLLNASLKDNEKAFCYYYLGLIEINRSNADGEKEEKLKIVPKYLSEIEKLSKSNEFLTGYMHNLRGVLFLTQNDFGNSCEFLNNALQIFHKNKYFHMLTEVYENLGFAHQQIDKNMLKAIQYFEESEQYAHITNNFIEIIKQKINAANCFFILKQMDRVNLIIEMIKDIIDDKMNSYKFYKDFCSIKIYKDIKSLPVNIVKMYERLNRKIKSEDIDSEINELKSKFNSVLKDDFVEKPLFSAFKNEIIEAVFDDKSIVLITGETGTGKTFLAKKIHELSKRKDKDFYSFDIAGLPESLIEAELFGYKKGAFTGAIQDRAGYFEYANGGTLLIDEIGDASLNIQLKLREFIETRKFHRLGENAVRHSDVKLIIATNMDLKEMIAEKKFRDDLYYRLSDVNIHIKPLRERSEEITAYMNYFFHEHLKRFLGRKYESLKNEYSIDIKLSNEMMKLTYKGNIRELQTIMQSLTRKLLINHGKILDTGFVIECMSSLFDMDYSGKDCKPKAHELFVREKSGKYLIKQFDKFKNLIISNKGNLSGIARLIHVSRQTLDRIIFDNKEMSNFFAKNYKDKKKNKKITIKKMPIKKKTIKKKKP